MISREVIMTLIKKSLRFLPDIVYIKIYYKLRVGRKLNIDAPKTLNEKLQWIKINYRFPLQTVVSDKYAVRDYVKSKIGEEYLIPLLGEWTNFDEIDFEELPEQFVLKCNHDSGGLLICQNRNNLDVAKVKKTFKRCLKSNFYYIGREYQYKNIKPRLICEQFVSNNGKIPEDYKIYCFNGKADVILVCTDRFKSNSHRAKYYFFDQNWNFLRYNKGDDIIDIPNLKCPKNLNMMISIAEKLSEDFIFARIDLYNIDGRIYFGEITLSPNSGFDSDITRNTDELFGEKLKIPYWDILIR